MVQLQIFPTSDYLFKISYCDNNKIERKNLKKIFPSFEISKNIILRFSWRALIGQNDSLDVLLLDEFFLRFKKGRNDLTQSRVII